MPQNMIASPTRVVMNALKPAFLGVMRLGSSYLRANQKLISRYEQRPMISQKTKSSTRLSASTNPNIPVAKREM